MANQKIKVMLVERRTTDRGAVGRDADVGEDFRKLLDDLDNDIYEASFPPEIYDFEVVNTMAEAAKKGRAENFHFILFYRLAEGNYKVSAVLRDLTERMAAGGGPICLVSFGAAQVEFSQMIQFNDQMAEKMLSPTGMLVREAWIESIKTPGIVLTSLQEMTSVGKFMQQLAGQYAILAKRRGAYYDPAKGFMDTLPAAEALAQAGDKGGRLGGFFKKK